MKKLIIITLFLIPFFISAQCSTNILLWTRFQWSTNAGATWSEDAYNIALDPLLVRNISLPVGSDGNCFFQASIADNGDFDVWHSFIVTTYASTNSSSITIPLATNTFYVFPNILDGYDTNIEYRVVEALTNYAAPVFLGTNTTIDTNLPPPP